MTSDAILTELRALPGAPDRLRERVRSLPEPKPRIAWTPPHVDVRRTLLVLAPAVVALGVGAAALHGVLSGGTNGQTVKRPIAIQATEWHGKQHGSGATSTVPQDVPTYGALPAPPHALSGGS